MCTFCKDILVTKNFKPKTQLCNFWRQNFVQKMQAENVDEIDSLVTLFSLYGPCPYVVEIRTSIVVIKSYSKPVCLLSHLFAYPTILHLR
jgi:hypothetical protein